VSVACPNGHVSATPDYCDQCGEPIEVIGNAQRTEELQAVEEADTSPATRRRPCPVCGEPRSGDARFCEACGYDYLAAARRSAGTWEAIVSADRQQFERFAVEGLEFPADYAERRFTLDAPVVRIGRSRDGRSDESPPEIDLAGGSEDPGISRRHAVLERLEDGSYSVRDLGSTNGTIVDDRPDPVGTDSACPLADGDRIRLGVWTTITVRRPR
jgi:FHA domain/Double zinc ribbon